jgi:hypothetical protein
MALVKVWTQLSGVELSAIAAGEQAPLDELKRRHGPKSTSEVVDRWWDTPLGGGSVRSRRLEWRDYQLADG